jgi:hypothetical protein
VYGAAGWRGVAAAATATAGEPQPGFAMLKNLFLSARKQQAAAPLLAFPLKLNLGCGYSKLDDYVNVDKFAAADPDMVVDLEILPWPFPDSCATHVEMSHVLEHMGQESSKFLRLIQELWRVCAPQASVTIRVPHPRHDNFLGDPTHVRPIIPATLQVFDQQLNREGIASNSSTSSLGLYLGVDFQIAAVEYVLDPGWQSRLDAGEVTAAQVFDYSISQNNVLAELVFNLIAHKPGRG